MNNAYHKKKMQISKQYKTLYMYSTSLFLQNSDMSLYKNIFMYVQDNFVKMENPTHVRSSHRKTVLVMIPSTKFPCIIQRGINSNV